MKLSKLLERVTILVKEGVKESTAKIKGRYTTIKLDVFVLMANMVFVQQSNSFVYSMSVILVV